MAKEDHNRFKSNTKWIEWKSLNDGETLLYSQKNYNKPRDEEALKKKIKYRTRRRRRRRRKRAKTRSPTMRVQRKVFYLQHQINQINQRE